MPQTLSRQVHSAEHPVERLRRSFGIPNCIQQRKISEIETQLQMKIEPVREEGTFSVIR